MEFDEHEDQEEMEEIPPVQVIPPAGYVDSAVRSGGDDAGASSTRKPGGPVRYMECLRNHAVGIGRSAVDGCGEFLAAGEEGTLDGLLCAACGCHRNFHRKETVDYSSAGGGGMVVYHQGHPHHHHHHQFSPYYRAAPPPAGYLHLTTPPPHQQQYRPLALPSTSREDLEDVSNPSSSGGGGGGSGRTGLLKKRFRTKFTQEQKDRMLALAERLGWRIQKHDEAAVEEFCLETGVKRHVLKIWMHNNKHTLGKKP
ncbi:hypothetical protein SAY87_014078 [Trapa incisa]|uniref:ZF-HD dimerization-type domain-containing protein n=1 Tax=Trapa incisa TaxID=236973 RepID=A0AAN7H2G9_9MYRT|nr:hypothetical protein SAY87_014078 [Trapa incisa]